MFIMTINNKSERNYRGKCLGWPVTSYGAAVHADSIKKEGVAYAAKVQTEDFGQNLSTDFCTDQILSILYTACVYKIV